MILKGRKNVKAEKMRNSHGGEGGCLVRTLMTEEFSSSLAYIREIDLEPGASIGIHKHAGDEEIYYIVSGSGTIIVDDEKQKVHSGDVVLTKSGSSHGLINDSRQNLKFFVACAKV